MSGESTDSESIPSENYKRAHSLLRQVRASITGRNLEIPSVRSIRRKRRSFESLPPKKQQQNQCRTPNAFSRHLSLINQVKSHLTSAPKYRQTIPSIWHDHDDGGGDDDADEFQSVPSIDSTSVSHFTVNYSLFISIYIFFSKKCVDSHD